MSQLGKYARESEYSNKSKNKTAFKLDNVVFMAIFVFQKDEYKGKALKFVLDSGKEELLYGNTIADAEKLEAIFKKWVDLNEPKVEKK